MNFGSYRNAVRIDRIDDTRVGARLGMRPTWTPVVARQPCQVIECRAEEVLQSAALQVRHTHKVYFRKALRADDGTALYLTDQHRLAWTDREGRNRYLRVKGAMTPPGPNVPHAARCEEITEGQA